jgi:2-polyprenyl-3-methyl-5-hydroxy-6-metoxy-1,4-benzoquinol methylase
MNSLVSFFRRKILRIPEDRWNYQYAQGEWDGLNAESVRLDAVISMIGASYRAPAILEIGCGKAVMLGRMPEDGYSTFTGIDLSQVAISGARLFETERVRFLQADMQTFIPQRSYDVIAFNESLYYAKDPAAVFARYLPFLTDGGSIIVTAFRNKYTAHLWPALDQTWQAADSQQVRDGNLVWDIRMFRPQA